MGSSDQEGSVKNMITRSFDVAEDVVNELMDMPEMVIGAGGSIFVEIVNELAYMIVRVFETIKSGFVKVANRVSKVFIVLISDIMNLIQAILLFVFLLVAIDPTLAKDGMVLMSNTLVALISAMTGTVASGTSALNTGTQGFTQVGTSSIGATKDVVTSGVQAGTQLADRAITTGADLAKSAGSGVASGIRGIAGQVSKSGDHKRNLETLQQQQAPEMAKTNVQRAEGQEQRAFELEKTGLEGRSRERIEQTRAEAGGGNKRLQLRSILGTPDEYAGLNSEQRAMRVNNALAEGFSNNEVDEYIKRNDKFVENTEARYNEIINNFNQSPYNISTQVRKNLLIEAFKDNYSNEQDKVNRMKSYLDWYYSGEYYNRDMTMGNLDPNLDIKRELHDELESMDLEAQTIIGNDRLRENSKEESNAVRRMIDSYTQDRINTSIRYINNTPWNIFDQPNVWTPDN